MFRNIGGMIGPRDDPVLVHRWVHGEEFHVRLLWEDPLNVIAGKFFLHFFFTRYTLYDSLHFNIVKVKFVGISW